MVYGLWFMVYGLWFMVYGLWFMVYGLWFMVYGLWFMVYGLWCEGLSHTTHTRSFQLLVRRARVRGLGLGLYYVCGGCGGSTSLRVIKGSSSMVLANGGSVLVAD
jgi:hypothetical protein